MPVGIARDGADGIARDGNDGDGRFELGGGGMMMLRGNSVGKLAIGNKVVGKVGNILPILGGLISGNPDGNGGGLAIDGRSVRRLIGGVGTLIGGVGGVNPGGETLGRRLGPVGRLATGNKVFGRVGIPGMPKESPSEIDARIGEGVGRVTCGMANDGADGTATGGGDAKVGTASDGGAKEGKDGANGKLGSCGKCPAGGDGTAADGAAIDGTDGAATDAKVGGASEGAAIDGNDGAATDAKLGGAREGADGVAKGFTEGTVTVGAVGITMVTDGAVTDRTDDTVN